MNFDSINPHNSDRSVDRKLLPEKENGITLPEIAELEEPIKKIIEQIRSKIENGEYGLIIGDDVSGRIPARILGGVIKKIAKLKGVRDPDLIFIPGKLSRNQNLSKQLQDYISKYGVKEKDRILIVTESIESGNALSTLLDVLIKSGYRCDIATLGIEQSDSEYYKGRRTANLSGADVISGGFRRKEGGQYYWMHQNTPSVFASKSMSGVSKRGGDSISRVIQPTDSGVREGIRKSRVEAGIMVDRLVSWCLSQDTANNLEKV